MKEKKKGREKETPNTKEGFLGKVFLFCFSPAVFWNILPQNVPKSIEKQGFFPPLSLFGWFFLFLFKIKHHAKNKETQ